MLGRFAASLGVLRPRAVARTQRSVDALIAETQEVRRTLKQLADGQTKAQASSDEVLARLDSMSGDIRALQARVKLLALRESQLTAVMKADGAQESALADLSAICDREAVGARIRAAVDEAELHLDPFPYMLVRNVFPDDYYDALVRGIPPVEVFGDKPFNKQQIKVPFVLAPAYSRRVWNFFVNRVGPRVLQPAVIEKFRKPLEDWIALNWPALADNPFAPPMDFHMGDGRIMLRGRGYRIPPHRDPKWGFVTCLLYLAREEDSEAWGTQLFSVDQDPPARGAAPHWIDASRCRLAADIPFRRNTMLVFLNSTGAHGAQIPDDAEPENLTRYTYQCRIGPSGQAIRALMATLPEENVPLWAGKVSSY
jgi:hypothetical protein